MYGVYIEFLGKGETVLGEKYISFAILEREGCIRDKIKKPTKKKKKERKKIIPYVLDPGIPQTGFSEGAGWGKQLRQSHPSVMTLPAFLQKMLEVN